MFNSFPCPRKDSGSNIKSVQQGIANISGQTLNVPISAVDNTKSIVLVYSGGNTNVNASLIAGVLTSSINIQFSIFGTSGGSFTWEVIEFKSLKSFQSGNATTVSTTVNVTISSVDITKAMLFFNFKSTNNSTASADSSLQGYLSTATNIAFLTFNLDKNVNWYVVEFY